VILPSVVTVVCPACKGEGTYRMGCSRAVCHVCRGRTFLRGQLRGVASSVEEPNRGKGGGESKIKNVAVLVLGLLACSSSASAPQTDAGGSEAGQAPMRGPGILADAAVLADAVPRDAVPSVLVPDAMPVVDAVPDAVPDTVPVSLVSLPGCKSDGTKPLYGPPGYPRCTSAHWPDGGALQCFAGVGGFVELPCIVPAGTNDAGQSNIEFVAVASCQECPL
jgi:hypothetical protein